MSLRKIQIIAFGDEQLVGKEIGRFTLPINPESMNTNSPIGLETSQPIGSQHTSATHASTPSQELKLEFILDHTNTIEGNTLGHLEVPVQLKMFTDLVYKLNGDIRRPNFLKIIWSDDFAFDCQLTNMGVQNTLFSPVGKPIRVKVTATFKKFVAPKLRVLIENKIQGAVTKVQEAIDAGENLANTAQKVYNDVNMYLQIAKTNDIANFRGLAQNATNLVLPPIKKASEAVDKAKNAANDAKNLASSIKKLF